MTYWMYHLVFTLPAILFFGIRWRHHIRMPHILSGLLISTIAFVFTWPWDNYAVYLGIWGFAENASLGYPNADARADSAFNGWIPFEEYAFFVIESILVIIFLARVLPKPDKPRGDSVLENLN